MQTAKKYRCPEIATIIDHGLVMSPRGRANKPWETVHKPQSNEELINQQGDHNARHNERHTGTRQGAGPKHKKDPASSCHKGTSRLLIPLNRHFIVKERFIKLIWYLYNHKMWHLTACKISVTFSFLKWNDFFYRISELMLVTKSFHFKNVTLG